MAKTKQDKLRVALIGTGGIAGAHMRYYQDMDDVKMVAAADVVLERAQKYCEEYEIPAAFADYEEMLRQVEPDAVSVCTPNGLHAPCSIAALDAGSHVLVEKPLAMNAREGQQMLDAAEKNNKKLIIGFQNRYDPKTQFIKKLVDDGELGTVLYARVQSLRRRGIPNWGVFGRKDLQGGGPLIDIGVHVLEATHYAMGSPKPVAASGSTYTYIGDKPSNVASIWPNWDYKTYTVEDLAVGHIRFANGAMLSIETSFAAHIEKGEGNFTLMGEKGGATWDPPGFFHDANDYMVNTRPDWLPTGPAADGFGQKMRNFVDHVLYGAETLSPGEHGLMVQKMMDGIYESAEQEREVRIE